MLKDIPLSLLTEQDNLWESSNFENCSILDLLGAPLKEWIRRLLQAKSVDSPKILGKVHEGAIIEGPVYIAEGAIVEPTAFVKGPTFIGPDTEVRHGAYVRGNVYAGRGCVIGHATEIKGSVMLDGAKAGHFAYIGDSILGQNVNLGAGTKLANLRLDGAEVKITPPGRGRASSGLRKLGGLLSDHSQTGCNSVLNPGTWLEKGAFVAPCDAVRGLIHPG